jgi:hypothetical protein
MKRNKFIQGLRTCSQQKVTRLIILVLPFLMCSTIKTKHFDKYYLISLGYLSEVKLDGDKLIELQTIRLIDTNSHETFLDTLVHLDNISLNKTVEINSDPKHEGLIYIYLSKQEPDSCHLILFSKNVFESYSKLKDPRQITKTDCLKLTHIIGGYSKKNNPKEDGLMDSQIYFNSVLFQLGYNPLITLEQFHDLTKGF